MLESDWAEQLEQFQSDLTRREVELVSWIEEQPHSAAFARLQKLADSSGVSKPTIISCYQKLGYSDYREFQQGIQNFYAGQIDSYHSSSIALKDLSSMDDLILASLEVERRSLENLERNLDSTLVRDMARTIIEAKNVYVYGAGTGQYPGHYLVQRLRRCGISSYLAGGDREHMPDELAPIGKGDVFLSFYYTQDSDDLDRALEFCSSRGAKNLLIADYLETRHCRKTDAYVCVPRGQLNFKNSMSLPMAFAQILLLAVEFLGGEEIALKLKSLELLRKTIKSNSQEEL